MSWISNVVPPKIRNFLAKREVPQNLWIKCPETGEMVFHRDLEANHFVIPNSGFHMRMNAQQRFAYFFDGGAWEIEVLAADGTWREVTVGTATAKVTADRAGRSSGSDAAEARGLKNTKVTAQQAAATALRTVPGAVTSVELENEGAKPAWEVEITGKDGARHELLVDGAGGTVTRNEAEHDDHGGKEDDGKKDDGEHEGKHADGKHRHDDRGGQDDA